MKFSEQSLWGFCSSGQPLLCYSSGMLESMTGHLRNISGGLNLSLKLVILVIMVKNVTFITLNSYLAWQYILESLDEPLGYLHKTTQNPYSDISRLDLQAILMALARWCKRTTLGLCLVTWVGSHLRAAVSPIAFPLSFFLSHDWHLV